VDPYSYRHALTQPKLIINGTNDEYWVTDATNIYWNDLRGEKYLLYVPNNVHGLKDFPRLIGSVLALHQHQAGGIPMPRFEWEHTVDAPGVISLSVSSEPRADVLRVWSTTSETADLRESTWESKTLRGAKGIADYRASANHVYQAFFIEAEFRDERSLPLYLSTTMRVIPPAGEAAPPVAASQ
jgi:PhoPQ-activated pathogenicity-related protein